MIDRNTWIMYGILAIVLFFGGFIIGYLTWGTADEGVDYKVMLKDAADYIAKLENDNVALTRAAKPAAAESKSDSSPETSAGVADKSAEAAKPDPAVAADESAGVAVESTQAASPEPAGDAQDGGSTLASQTAAVMAALDNEKDLAQKHVVLTEKVQAVLASQKELEEENARLQATIGEKESLMAELEQSKAAARACMAEKEQLTLAKAELEANINQNQALIDQNESLQIQLKKMTGEVDAMRSRLVEIQSIAGVDKTDAPEPTPAEQPEEQAQEQPSQ